ncbi:MAG: hypothetical protein Harvfovirus19_18 [Harvfovirus sp.]|uniref:Uncharacterized protein n=1 Tax=Harvfovirus sp. TaxID=2487768 RepID=A0A3G5A5S3_9VIRU|nr:MAG: hypothetical protein Harvfovirus19_18 [Harvfovirus sp.]
MSAKLVGFSLRASTVHPVYKKPCSDCSTAAPLSGYAVSINELSVLSKTPEEIKQLDETEIARLRLLINRTWVDETYCPCPLKSPTRARTSLDRRINPHDYCWCNKYRVMEILHKGSWSCPFCISIFCDKKCFGYHLNEKCTDEYGLTLVGGEWCPMCRKVFRESNISFPHMMTKEKLHSLIRRDGLDKYTIKNTLCESCKGWDEKKILEIPLELKGRLYLEKVTMYAPERWTPPYISQNCIKLSDLSRLEIYDDHTQFFVSLLKYETFERIDDSLLDHSCSNRGELRDYYHFLWKEMIFCYEEVARKRKRLRTVEEIKKMVIPGAKILAAVRGEIRAFENGLAQTPLLRELYVIIGEYLLWQLLNFERLLARIIEDAVQYAPSVANLLFVCGRQLPKLKE